MRLTVDLRMYLHSGIGRYLRNLFPLLLPRLNAAHIRVLGTPELFSSAEWLEDSRVEVFKTAAKIYSIEEQLLGLRGAYRDTDLLWVPHYNGPLFYTGRMMATMHDIAPVAMPQILDSAIKRAYAKLLIRRTVLQAAKILCVSEFTQSEVKRHFCSTGSRCVVTRLGLDADWPRTTAPHREADGVPYLLFVGNIKPNKNLSLLLKAFDSVKDRIPHRLVIVGRTEGFGTGDSTVLANASNLGDRVRLAGEVPDEALQQLYGGAAALVVPSLYEGFGLTLLEAMQLGCPVISSTAGSLPEVGGGAVMFFDPLSPQALTECLIKVQNDTLMKKLSELGRLQIKHFSFTLCADQTAAVINEQMQALT